MIRQTDVLVAPGFFEFIDLFNKIKIITNTDS